MSLAEAAQPTEAGWELPASPPEPLPRTKPPLPRQARISPRRDMRCSVADAAAYSVMVGIGETYVPAFMLALTTQQTLAGLVATLPMLAGASLQLATPWALRRFRSYRTWVVMCASLQAAALLLMPIAAWFAWRAAAAWLFVAAALYWAASQATSPAWNTWIEEIIPKRVRANYFACRARISQACTLLGFVAGGLALQAGKASGWLLATFAAIFLVGSACRFLSAWFLSRQTEPSVGRYVSRQISLGEMFSRTQGDVGSSLVWYLLAVQTAVQISGPYFTPYMLVHQQMDYITYMVLIGIGFLGKVIALPLWGRVAHYAGPRRLLWIGGTSIVPIAAMWIFVGWFGPELSAGRLIYIGLIQLISGLVWAAYELAMLLMFFEAIPRQDRASVLTFYNFGNAAALCVGGLIGAIVLQIGREQPTAYLVLFGLSSLARLGTVLLLRQAPDRAIDVTTQPAVRVIAVRADEGGVDRPILSSLSETSPTRKRGHS